MRFVEEIELPDALTKNNNELSNLFTLVYDGRPTQLICILLLSCHCLYYEHSSTNNRVIGE